MTDKTPATPDDPEQSKRFIDMARDIEATEDPKRSEKVFDVFTKGPNSGKKSEKT